MRKVGLLLLAGLLSAAMLPATVAAKGQGNLFHGGNPTAPVNVTCAIEQVGDSEFYYDVVATIDPDVVLEMFSGDYPFALAWQKTSAKASALSLILGELSTDELSWSNFVWGEGMYGEGPPFGYVQVQVGYAYYDYDLGEYVYVILASGTAKCGRGSLEFFEE